MVNTTSWGLNGMLLTTSWELRRRNAVIVIGPSGTCQPCVRCPTGEHQWKGRNLLQFDFLPLPYFLPYIPTIFYSIIFFCQLCSYSLLSFPRTFFSLHFVLLNSSQRPPSFAPISLCCSLPPLSVLPCFHPPTSHPPLSFLPRSFPPTSLRPFLPPRSILPCYLPPSFPVTFLLSPSHLSPTSLDPSLPPPSVLPSHLAPCFHATASSSILPCYLPPTSLAPFSVLLSPPSRFLTKCKMHLLAKRTFPFF